MATISHNFYPRPPRGGRHLSLVRSAKSSVFLSTPSARRATSRLVIWVYCPIYFYPRPPRGGRRGLHGSWTASKHFYPRPPRGGRHYDHRLQPAACVISIHALREEGDTKSPHTSFWLSIFLSTPSARRATQKVAELTKRYNISIHALREEGDHGDLCYIMPHDNFYPRPPRGGRRCLTA